jgi:hypothetical protein
MTTKTEFDPKLKKKFCIATGMSHNLRAPRGQYHYLTRKEYIKAMTQLEDIIQGAKKPLSVILKAALEGSKEYFKTKKESK